MTSPTVLWEAVTNGPPKRAPERVNEDSVTKGLRVAAFSEERGWTYDLRAVDNPYWYDEETHLRWLPGSTPPAGADSSRARLFVAVAGEQDYYGWSHTKRRPRIHELPAYLVWLE